MRNEEDKEELDEIHEALQSSLNSTDGSSLFLLYLLLEYLVDSQVCNPQSKPAGDDPCTERSTLIGRDCRDRALIGRELYRTELFS